MKKSIFIPLFTFVFLILFYSCKKKDIEIVHHYYLDYETLSQTINIPPSPLEYNFPFPKYYGRTEMSFDKDKATLGRVLFYDKNLSKDRSVSCGSCHIQSLAFADGEILSDGIENQKTERNSIALGSVFSFNEYYGSTSIGRIPFFWDNRATSVEEQTRQTFANSKEMGMQMHQVTSRVADQDFYQSLFQNAYSDPSISQAKILECISEFVNSIGSFNSTYDQELDKLFNQGIGFSNLEGINMSGLSVQQNIGKDLFLNNCSSCHGNINGRPGKTQANNGLDMHYSDNGISQITNNASDQGEFKIPTLRNIASTAPYMHDGRFATLEDVIDFYSGEIQNHPNLDIELKQNGEAKKFNFSQEEKEAMISFFDSFTDQTLLTDERYSDPFKQ